LNYPSPIVEVEAPGTPGPQKVVIPTDEMFRVQSIFESHEYNVSAYLPSGALTIVDIGANVGLFALYMKTLHPNSDIHCFEPAPQTQKLLLKNLEGHHRIDLYPFALSDYDGTAELHLHPENTGENSLKQDQISSDQSVSVEVRDAAAAFQQVGLTYVDILKIDTEGSEIEILKSLHRFLPYVGIVIAEYHSEADRRTMDGLLPDHLLFDARAHDIHLGVLKYINARLIPPE